LFFIQIMAVLAITAVVLSTAAVLLGRAWKSHRTAVAAADRAMVFEQMTAALRRDVTAATVVRLDGDTLTLGGALSWSADGTTLRRRDAVSLRTFDVDTRLAFAPAPGGAKLQLTEPDGQTNAVTFVSPIAWGKEVMR
jgi:hypothetical protein